MGRHSQKTCRFCGEEYWPRSGNQKWCGPYCREQAGPERRGGPGGCPPIPKPTVGEQAIIDTFVTTINMLVKSEELKRVALEDEVRELRAQRIGS